MKGLHQFVSVPDAHRSTECFPLGHQRPDGIMGVAEARPEFLCPEGTGLQPVLLTFGLVCTVSGLVFNSFMGGLDPVGLSAPDAVF